MATFGLDSGDGFETVDGGTLCAGRFQNTVGDGNITKIELLFNETSPYDQVRLGVYADSSGSPGTRLLDAGLVNVGAGWIEIAGLSLAVTLNTYYWLAYNQVNNNDVEYKTGQPANSAAWKNGVTAGTLPNPFGTPSGTGSSPYVMRATVTSGNIPVTVTPGPEIGTFSPLTPQVTIIGPSVGAHVSPTIIMGW